MKKWLPYICAGLMGLLLLVQAFYGKNLEEGADGQQVMSLFGASLLAVGGWSRFRREKELEHYEQLIRPEGRVSFLDIAGNEEAVSGMRQLVDYLINPEDYDAAGARMPSGVLLYGPPGTGKTLLARAVAGEAGVPFITKAGSDFVQMYAGVGAKRVRELFKQARGFEKSVVFIDEIDALGKRRGAGDENAEREQTLNALLSEMSGFKGDQKVLVIAATNRAEVLDEALTRPGRFDRLIEVGLPDVKAREKILRLLLNKIGSNADASRLAKKTTGYSGAALESLVNEAAIMSVKQGGIVSDETLDQAYIETLAGKTKEDTALNDGQKHRVAVHEAGHALACRLFLPEENIVRVSVLPSVRGAGGYVVRQVAEGMPTRKSLLGAIDVALAGRAAEELFFGKEEISIGAANDLQQASMLVRKLTGEYALEPGFGLLVNREVDEDRLNDILEREYTCVLDTLEMNIKKLVRLVDALEYMEQMSGDEVDEAINAAFLLEKSEALA